MMIFVDSAAFIARYLVGDAHHRAAAETWRRLGNNSLVTSNHVIDETLTYLGRRAGYVFAADLAERIHSSTALEILYSAEPDELEAVRLFRKYADQKMSFTDCVSFVLMKRLRISTVFTFDRHFALAGFRVLAAADQLSPG